MGNNLNSFNLSDARSTPEALALVPLATALRLGVLPLEITDDGSLAALAKDPADLSCRDELRSICGRTVTLRSAGGGDLDAEINRAYGYTRRIAALSEEYLAREPVTPESSNQLSDDSPTAQIVTGLLTQAMRERASDVHLEPTRSGTRVRFRIDGRLVDSLRLELGIHPSVTARIKILAGMDIAEKRLPQDGRIIWQYRGRAIDVRVSTLPSVHGEKTVLRLLDPEHAGLGLEALGCEGGDLERIEELLRVPNGLILNTGPTGSGKTTTLYAMLRRLDLEQYNAVAVEDPVEYHIHGVTQVQVNERAGLTFAGALRSILRQDPDIILVGEIRDAETAALAVRAALTGHLVLATIHANDAPSAPSRLIDMGVAPYLLSSVLRGVLAQRLLRVLCPKCHVPYEVSAEAAEELGIPAGTTLYRAAGCLECGGRGYRGRTAVFQVMTVDEELSMLIARGAASGDLAAAARRKGMRTMQEAALEKVRSGVTGLEETGLLDSE